MEKTFIHIEFWQLVGFLLSFLGICFTFGKMLLAQFREQQDERQKQQERLTEENFESESFGGNRWKQSQRAAQGGQTLQLTGQLAASISTQVGNDFARIGSNKPYAAIHHLGGSAGRNHSVQLPARPYLPINGSGQLQNGADKRILDIAIESLSSGL